MMLGVKHTKRIIPIFLIALVLGFGLYLLFCVKQTMPPEALLMPGGYVQPVYKNKRNALKSKFFLRERQCVLMYPDNGQISFSITNKGKNEIFYEFYEETSRKVLTSGKIAVGKNNASCGAGVFRNASLS